MDKSLQQVLLDLARRSMAAHLGGSTLPIISDLPLNGEYAGAFVSLHLSTRLRGCIGRFECNDGVVQTIQRVAVAVLSDPRFINYPVMLEEFNRLTVEISLLSPMQRISDPLKELDLGIHGIFIRQGLQAGCFLPKVAAMMGWDAIQLLSRCCSDKAGLPPEAWKDPLTEVYLFAAETFSDEP